MIEVLLQLEEATKDLEDLKITLTKEIGGSL